MTLAEWNAINAEAAAQAVLPCCGSEAWAKNLAAQRPFTTFEELSAASDAVWWALPERDWQQAFDSHPRIGQAHAKAATEKSLKWSEGEQAAANPDDAARAALALGNDAYEKRFGRIFIVCATGKSATEMLGILQKRMENDAVTELREAAEQQRLITQIRLKKWLQL
ncbi:MAG TPA: 2-oxo-4-hydroxy-4-carboxy-5-ureidoimidazoline decarboxylase [Acidobacteriaceae bacterium]|jgi:2-oxo-4-hydroxy-4-carboxy-5-ureidoimidazoline decarboxylase|nr:2-oxo-4-hydroxy-4-carboxy-5-ureidoimidazoline decarboxylase [Acidobacteriaceae bacterium]